VGVPNPCIPINEFERLQEQVQGRLAVVCGVFDAECGVEDFAIAVRLFLIHGTLCHHSTLCECIALSDEYRATGDQADRPQSQQSLN